MNPIWNAIAGPILQIIDKVIPDPQAKRDAQMKVLELQQQGALRSEEIQLSAILEEARSKDPWTSRARPSFMYVMYVMILFSLPIGILAAFDPQRATAIGSGMNAWLGSFPEEIWWLFGAGFLGYTGSRTYEKRKGIAK